MSILIVALGVTVLLYGRTLYWGFVAIAGFLIGFELAAELLRAQPESVRLLIAIAGGVIGALLGMVAQRIAFSIAGCFAGGYLAINLDQAVHLPGEPAIWALVGAVAGAILAAMVMDWAIIVLSSLAGAAAVVDQFHWQPPMPLVVFIVLCLLGISIQGRRLRYNARAL